MPAIGCWVYKLEDSFAAAEETGEAASAAAFAAPAAAAAAAPGGGGSRAAEADGASAAAENEGGNTPSAPLSCPADADDDLPLLLLPYVHIFTTWTPHS